MKINKVIVNRDSPMIVRNEFVFSELVSHIKDALEKSSFRRDSSYSFINGFIMLSSLSSFRRGHMEWNDERVFCVGIVNEETHELKLISLFDLMPELKDLYEE